MPKLVSSPSPGGQPPNSLSAQRALLNKLYQQPAYQRPPIDLTQFRQQPLPPVPYSDPATPPPPQATPPNASVPKTAPPPPPPTTPINVPPPASPGNFTQVPKPTTGAPPGSGAAAGGAVVTTSGGVVSTLSKFANTPAGFLGLVATGLLLHNARQLYRLWKLSQPESKPLERTEGYGEGVIYSVAYEVSAPNRPTGYDNVGLFGPIGDARIVFNGTTGINQISCRGIAPRSLLPTQQWVTVGQNPGQTREAIIKITKITRSEGQPEDLEPTSLKRAPVKSGLNDPSLPPSSRQSNKLPAPTPPSKLPTPTPPPPADQTFQQNNRVPVTISTPGGAPITISTPGGGSATFTPPNGNPNIIKVPRPRPITVPDIKVPSPTTAPPPPKPITINTPDAPSPATFTFPGTEPITINFPGAAPIVVNPVGTSPPVTGGTPTDRPQAFVPTPTVTPPTTQPPPTTKPPTTTPDTDNPLEGIKDPDLAKIGLGLVGITQLIRGIQGNTTPTAIKNAVCSTTQPGGCSSNMTNNAVNAGNKDLKDWLKNNGLDAAGLAQNKDTNTRVRNIENRTGSNEYPMVLPEYLLDDYLDKQVIIENQVQYNAWLLKQLDALIGLFPIKIERTNEDGQKETLVFENIAEAIAELTGLLAQIAFDADTAVNVSTRATGEAIGAKAAALQAGSYLKAIVDYMGFQGQSISIDVPISVTPGAVGLDGKLQESELKDFLKPSTQKAIGFKNTDPVDQRLVLRRILESGEISRAALFRPLKPNKDENPLTGDAIKADKKAEEKRINDLWEAFKLRMEGHTAGTKVDIDDGVKPDEGGTP